MLRPGGIGTTALMTGYARCSTDEQDLTAQHQALQAMGVPPERIYMDKGLTGTTGTAHGLDQALATLRAGDTLANLLSVSKPTVYRGVATVGLFVAAG